jgi:uncharacterized membrane protein YcaP (DUF421 family)
MDINAHSLAEVFFQTLLAFGAVVIYARLLGKQQVGQLTIFEYVNGITLGSIAGVLATDIGFERSIFHFSGLTIFATLTFLMGFISLKSRPLRKLISGEPVVVIHNGKILENNMKKMRYNMDELSMQLREQNCFNITDVEFAILETDGNLSVLPKSQKRPLTPADLNIPTEYEGLASELVVDGQIIFQNLKQNNLDGKWLLQELQKQGVTNVGEVAYASLDTAGQLYVDFKKDNLQDPRDITDFPKSPGN